MDCQEIIKTFVTLYTAVHTSRQSSADLCSHRNIVEGQPTVGMKVVILNIEY